MNTSQIVQQLRAERNKLDAAIRALEGIPAGASSSAQPGTAPGPNLLAWSHIYLGRIHDLEGERDQALGEYQAALAVSGAPDTAGAAGQRGVQVA